MRTLEILYLFCCGFIARDVFGLPVGIAGFAAGLTLFPIFAMARRRHREAFRGSLAMGDELVSFEKPSVLETPKPSRWYRYAACYLASVIAEDQSQRDYWLDLEGVFFGLFFIRIEVEECEIEDGVPYSLTQ